MSGPIPRPELLAIEPYVGGRASVAGVAQAIKLSSNESPLGPSPQAVAAFRDAADHLHIYPEGSAALLRAALGARHAIPPERIVCGNGSDEFLHLLPQIYCRPGDEVLFSAHAFSVYRIAAQAAGARVVTVPEPRRVVDVDALIAAVTPRTRVVFLANPNNPTGTYLPDREVRRLHAALPADTLFVIDAAYAEYATAPDYASGLALAATAGNVAVTHTFSKIYGLAALRLGWMTAAQPIIDVVNRVRTPFNVNTPAQAAGLAALADTAHVEAARAHNAEWLPWLTAQIRDLGYPVDPSQGNFVLIHFPDREGAGAGEADAFLAREGLILRRVTSHGLPHALRLTVGPAEANRRVVAALARFKAQAP